MWKKQYSLTEFTDEKNFKTYEELDARLNQVLNSKAPARRVDRETEEDEMVSAPAAPSSWNEEVSSFRSSVSAAPSLPSFNSEEEDDDLSYFARLAEED